MGEIQALFVQILLLARTAGVLKLGNLSLAERGTKIHADASKSQAVSYKRLIELEAQLRQEVQALLTLGEQADLGERGLPAGLVVLAEVAVREARLVNLAQAKAVLEARAQERYQAEKAGYDAKLRARDEKARKTKRRPRGKAPKPPTPGAQDKDQYNFTDPDSRIMKNSTDAGFDQQFNAQVAVAQDSLLTLAPAASAGVVAHGLSNHPNDQAEALPTLDALAPELGQPVAAALDTGFFSAANIAGMEARGIEPYNATGREAHHKRWEDLVAEQPAPPPAEATPIVKMAYKLKTDIGHAIYRLRKCTVEPVIGIIKEILGFRQFSLRGLPAAAGEWCLVSRSVAFNLKRLHILMAA